MKPDPREFILGYLRSRGRVPAGTSDAALTDAPFLDAGYLDSMATIDFVQELETEYGVRLTQNHFASAAFRTPRGVASIVEALLIGPK